MLIRIVGFLFCTVGLLYISVKILEVSPRYAEGFQADLIDENCRQLFMPDKTYWLCTNEYYAQEKVRRLVSTGDVYAGACFPATSGFYTCYTRPTRKVYNPVEGNFQLDDPSADGMPQSIEADITNVCEDYDSTWATFSTTYVSTIGLGLIVSSSLGEIKYATAQLSNVSTIYCSATSSRSAEAQRACVTLGTGISIFNGIPSVPKGLAFMSTTVFTAISSMDDLYTMRFTKPYKGFGYSTCSKFTSITG